MIAIAGQEIKELDEFIYFGTELNNVCACAETGEVWNLT